MRRIGLRSTSIAEHANMLLAAVQTIRLMLTYLLNVAQKKNTNLMLQDRQTDRQTETETETETQTHTHTHTHTPF